MSLTIRHANLDDAHTIAETERAIAQQPFIFCSQPSELTDENVVKTITAFGKEKTGVYLVAECKGQIVGHAFLKLLPLQSLRHVADLNLAVHPGWQKKGIGTKLLEQIMAWAKNGGLEKIILNVRASNSPAISLYKKMGFQEEARLKNQIKVRGHYCDDLIMGLDLRHKEVVSLQVTLQGN